MCVHPSTHKIFDSLLDQEWDRKMCVSNKLGTTLWELLYYKAAVATDLVIFFLVCLGDLNRVPHLKKEKEAVP